MTIIFKTHDYANPGSLFIAIYVPGAESFFFPSPSLFIVFHNLLWEYEKILKRKEEEDKRGNRSRIVIHIKRLKIRAKKSRYVIYYLL
jgi:hypothetical protein